MSTHSESEEADLHILCKSGDYASLSKFFESPDFDFDILFETDLEGFIPYHYSLIYSKSDCVALFHSLDLNFQVPYQGFMPIHLALSSSGFPSQHPEIIKTVLTLIKSQQDVTSRDRLGRSALHLSCAAGISSLIPILIQSGIRADLKDFSGKMAIHYAIENHKTECMKQLLQEGGSDMLFCTDSRGDKPIHLAVKCSSWECLIVLIALGSEEILNENNELEQTPEDIAKNCGVYEEFCSAKNGVALAKGFLSTLVITDDCCKLHAVLPPDLRFPSYLYNQQKIQPENPKRLETLLERPYGSLLAAEFNGLTWLKNISQAHISDILRVHEFSYVNSLQTCISKISENDIPVKFDIDTMVSSESYKAALIAANCAIRAVDEVMSGKFKNCFCAVRPPGHHVGPIGAVGSEEEPGSKSTGFCLFNNIAIAAGYAKYMYRSIVKKIAIVDFDVHHGNGTEAIVRNLTPSIITHPINSPPFLGTLEFQSYKPWLDSSDFSNVLFISSHAYGDDNFAKFYPATGTYNSGPELYPAGVLNIPLGKPTDSATFRMSNLYLDYREKVFPRLIEFAPDLLLISAGFDGHGLDVINHGFFDLDEDDYHWVTESLVKIANTCCAGRIVSILEGGYSIKGGVVSALGMSVAAHVKALNCANKEVWTSSPVSADAEKMILKNSVQEDLRQFKRRRRAYDKIKQNNDLENLMQEEFTNSEDRISGESMENSEDSNDRSEEIDQVEEVQELDPTKADQELLGNRTIE